MIKQNVTIEEKIALAAYMCGLFTQDEYQRGDALAYANRIENKEERLAELESELAEIL